MLLQDNQTIVFLDDGSTQTPSANSKSNPAAYYDFFQLLLAARHPALKFNFIDACVNSDSSRLMLGRLETDVLAQQPDWVLVNVGINDVRGQFSSPNRDGGIPIYEFGYNYAEIVRRIIASGARPLLLETILFGGSMDDDTLEGPANQLLKRYNTVINENADRFGAPVIALNEVLIQAERARRSGNPHHSYLADDVHLNPAGSMLYALTVYDYFANS